MVYIYNIYIKENIAYPPNKMPNGPLSTLPKQMRPLSLLCIPDLRGGI